MVGWYSTGPRLREADLDINALLSNYTETPVLIICEVNVRTFFHSQTSYEDIMDLIYEACKPFISRSPLQYTIILSGCIACNGTQYSIRKETLLAAHSGACHLSLSVRLLFKL